MSIPEPFMRPSLGPGVRFTAEEHTASTEFMEETVRLDKTRITACLISYCIIIHYWCRAGSKWTVMAIT